MEALERERRDQLRRLAGGDELREGRPDDRRRLEAVSAPACRDEEPVELGLPEDGAVVGREVTEAGPRAQHADAFELREELEDVARRVLEKRERALAVVGRVRLDLRADQELAAVGLRDVDVHLRRDDDHVEERFHRLRHEGLEDVGRDRQLHLGQVGDEGRPAGRGVHDHVRLDVPAGRLDPGHAPVRALDAGHLGVRVDLDPAPVGAARVPPDDRVVADDPAGRVVERRLHGPGDVLREIHLRAELGDLVRVDHARVDPEELVHLGAFVGGDDPAVRVRERQVALLGEEQVEVEVGREALVELDARLVELRALGRAVVRADDGRVAARGAGADIALLQDRHVRDAVVLRQVVGRGESVRAAADDDDVVVGPSAPTAIATCA